eukprot:7822279-Karenia_brevis.AAC.1
MITSSEDHGYQSEATAFMPEYGILNLSDSTHAEGTSNDDHMKDARESSMTNETSMPNVSNMNGTMFGKGNDSHADSKAKYYFDK